MLQSFRATVVVPTRDGAAHLPALLDAIERQHLPGGLELLCVDSGSRDGSLALAQARGARALSVEPAAFDHGETRNLGVRAARGRHVVFLSQDALPADEHLVRRLVEALEADERLAGVFARQAPRPGADPITRRDLGLGPAGGERPRRVFVPDAAAFEALPPNQRHLLAAFDNVGSAARRELLLEHPFPRARFGEDVMWAERMLRLGYGIAYVPEAMVLHSHRRSARALYRRNYLGHRLLARVFGLRTVPGRAHLLRAAPAAVLCDLLALARAGARPGLWLAAPGQALAAVYGQYRGARDETQGRAYPEWA